MFHADFDTKINFVEPVRNVPDVERDPCCICGRVPVLYQVHRKGFCKYCKNEAYLAARERTYGG